MSRADQLIDTEHVYRYACAESSVGRLLIVMSENGVVDFIRGENLMQLLSRALTLHPGASLIPDRGVHTNWVAAIVRRFAHPESSCAVPLDLGIGYGPHAAG